MAENTAQPYAAQPYAICVFCGSSSGNNPAHMMLAKELGEQIAARGHRLIYGGGGLGLMGATARAAHENGADVLGIIPEFLREVEKTFTEVTHEFVENMHERKSRMYSQANAFIVLPGGIGTLEEAIEVLSWQRLNLHQKPIIFLSNTNYWDGLLNYLSQIIEDGFVPASFQSALLSAKTISEAFNLIDETIEQNPIRHELHNEKDVLDKI